MATALAIAYWPAIIGFSRIFNSLTCSEFYDANNSRSQRLASDDFFDDRIPVCRRGFQGSIRICSGTARCQ